MKTKTFAPHGTAHKVLRYFLVALLAALLLAFFIHSAAA